MLSDPPGAKVWLDGKEIGVTPVTTPFSFYGIRELTLRREGYQIRTEFETTKPPWYFHFPVDAFTEFLWPFYLYDDHSFSYTLKPYLPMTSKQKNAFQDRAEKHKTQAYSE